MRCPLTRLKRAAALSLLQLGEVVSGQIWEEIAASAETRIGLADDLVARNRMELFPAKYLTQALVAESDLVRWMIEESEQACVPAKIELVKVIAIDPQTEDGLLDFYIFKFCMEAKHQNDAAAWKAGVAGPYLRDEQPTSNAEESPHSEFVAIDDKWPEEHLGDISEIVRDYRLRAGFDD